jgi:hypothetical protein
MVCCRYEQCIHNKNPKNKIKWTRTFINQNIFTTLNWNLGPHLGRSAHQFCQLSNANTHNLQDENSLLFQTPKFNFVFNHCHNRRLPSSNNIWKWTLELNPMVATKCNAHKSSPSSQRLIFFYLSLEAKNMVAMILAWELWQQMLIEQERWWQLDNHIGLTSD